MLAAAAVVLVKRVSTVGAVLAHCRADPVVDRQAPSRSVDVRADCHRVRLHFDGAVDDDPRARPGDGAEPVIAPALVAALIFAALPTGFVNRRVWIAAGVAVGLVALNPAYQCAVRREHHRDDSWQPAPAAGA